MDGSSWSSHKTSLIRCHIHADGWPVSDKASGWILLVFFENNKLCITFNCECGSVWFEWQMMAIGLSKHTNQSQPLSHFEQLRLPHMDAACCAVQQLVLARLMINDRRRRGRTRQVRERDRQTERERERERDLVMEPLCRWGKDGCKGAGVGSS